jgi:hypothetical protein
MEAQPMSKTNEKYLANLDESRDEVSIMIFSKDIEEGGKVFISEEKIEEILKEN